MHNLDVLMKALHAEIIQKEKNKHNKNHNMKIITSVCNNLIHKTDRQPFCLYKKYQLKKKKLVRCLLTYSIQMILIHSYRILFISKVQINNFFS